ncbi:MAG: methyltransferase domain-containing protein [Alphaproteobacteria bacterium]|nr:methyltransferase domain-containing protein [Alphaproteobacteria bacterium]
MTPTPQALHPAWLSAVDAVARACLGPKDRQGAALVEEIASLSQLYTRGREGLSGQRQHLAARLRFYLPRDLPKVEGPLLELAAQGRLPAGPTWRVLDLGAGLGTTTLGAAGVARRLGVEALEVTAVELDRPSLELAEALCARAGHGPLEAVCAPIALKTVAADVERIDPSANGPYDLILLGLSLNELAGGRLDRRLDLVKRWWRLLAPGGALVILEPALREVSRDLQRLRDALVALPKGPTLLAPCTHRGPCPLLERERDWCHGELDLPLPEPLAALARGAGLRWQRLTAAWLVLGATPAPPLGGYRVVGGPVESKGRCDWVLCGEAGAVTLGRLNRFKGPGDPLEGARRGSLLELEGEVGPKLRADRVGLRRVR